MTRYRELDREWEIKTSFAGAYTRIVITSCVEEPDKPEDVYGYEPENWLKNYVIAQEYDINLSAKVKLGEYEETIPLMTLSRTSDKNGNAWLRDITHDRLSFPWFLVRPGADADVPRVQVELNGSKAIGSGMAGAALQAALAGIKMVAPQATVLTRLSTNTAKDKAAAIDQVLGKLFSNKLGERHGSDRDLSKWTPNGGLEIAVRVPRNGKLDGELRRVGKWRVNFAPPRVSIFSDSALCDSSGCKSVEDASVVVRKETVDPATILAHPLLRTSAGDLSIKDYLSQQPWFALAAASMTGETDTDKRHAEGLCRSTADAMLKLGLNILDASLVVKAMIEGMSHGQVKEEAWKGTTCTRLLEGKKKQT